MASVTLVASGNTGLTGMSISGSYPITNAYDNSSDTSNYARCSISTSTTGYIYLTYDTSDIPETATIQSVAAKARLRISNTSRVSSRVCQLYTGTTAKGSNTNFSSTSSGGSVINLSTGTSWTRSELNNLRMKIGGTGSSSTSSKYIYIYGTDITITYVTESRTITTTLSGNGTIDPSGAQTMYDGDEYELIITPTNKSDAVTVTNNGVDVTEDLIVHHTGGTSSSYSTASGSGVTTGFARSGGAFYQSSSTSSDSWLRYAIGKTAESPYSTSNTSNTYCKDGTNDATTQGWMNYPFDFSSLPADAEVTAVEVKAYGAAESTTETARHADVSLWCGNEQKGTTQQFSSTSNSTMTISDPGEWTREELQNAWLRFGVGYYGGRILGITWKVTYTTGGTVSYYVYNYEVNGNATIAVTIGSSSNIPVTGVSLPSTATVEVGSSITLTPTISPTNATNQNVTWSSGNTARATVNNGVVTGVSAGTVVITVTTVDGNKTASCTVTIVAAVTYDYKLATSTVVGKKYLIANGNTGTVHLLTNESGGSRQLVGMSVTVSNGRISLTSAQKAKAEFECVRYTANNDNTITMKSDDKYIYTDNSTGLRMNAPTTLDRFWHYRDNKFWQFKSTTADGYEDTSTEYKYYLEMTGSNFTDNHVTSPSISDTDIPAIYIFVEDDGTTEQIYAKINGTWTQFSKVYKKVNGSWVEQSSSTWSTLFDTRTNYRKMN